MYIPARLGLLSLLLTLGDCQRSKPKTERAQGRTLGLLSPLLLGSPGGLYDVPVAPVGLLGAGGAATTGAAAGAQSDEFYGGGGAGGGYPGYGSNYGSNYGNLYGYRPNYGYGYPSLGLGYQNYYGYPNYGLGYYRPSNYYNYQRPVQYPQYYGSRPNYNNYGNYGNYGTPAYGSNQYGGALNGISSNPAAALSPGAGAGIGGPGSQLNSAQAAQIAGLLGQALGSSLRPLLANGGGGLPGAAGVGGNPQALSGLLGLLG